MFSQLYLCLYNHVEKRLYKQILGHLRERKGWSTKELIIDSLRFRNKIFSARFSSYNLILFNDYSSKSACSFLMCYLVESVHPHENNQRMIIFVRMSTSCKCAYNDLANSLS